MHLKSPFTLTILYYIKIIIYEIILKNTMAFYLIFVLSDNIFSDRDSNKTVLVYWITIINKIKLHWSINMAILFTKFGTQIKHLNIYFFN